MDFPPVPCACQHLAFVDRESAYVATGEVTSLEHELGDHTVELGALVAKALGAGAELLEVVGGLGDNIVVEVEVDSAGLLCAVLDVPIDFSGSRTYS